MEIAGAKFEHDQAKAAIELDRLRDETDLQVLQAAHSFRMLQSQGRLLLRAQREALKSEVSQ